MVVLAGPGVPNNAPGHSSLAMISEFSMKSGFLAMLILFPVACDDASTPSVPKASREPLRIRITGDDFAWHIRYPGPDGQLGSKDDVHRQGDLHLPAHRPIRIELTSHDYLYMLALPHLSLKEIAVPDITFNLDFKTNRPGIHELQGNQLCGFSHTGLHGALIVETLAVFDARLATPENQTP